MRTVGRLVVVSKEFVNKDFFRCKKRLVEIGYKEEIDTLVFSEAFDNFLEHRFYGYSGLVFIGKDGFVKIDPTGISAPCLQGQIIDKELLLEDGGNR